MLPSYHNPPCSGALGQNPGGRTRAAWWEVQQPLAADAGVMKERMQQLARPLLSTAAHHQPLIWSRLQHSPSQGISCVVWDREYCWEHTKMMIYMYGNFAWCIHIWLSIKLPSIFILLCCDVDYVPSQLCYKWKILSAMFPCTPF